MGVMTEKRIVELETKLAYQEDMIHELNMTIFDQQKRLDQLEVAYKYLIAQTQEQSESVSTGKLADEKPPHY